jgi:type I restriction enzyme S subunit
LGSNGVVGSHTEALTDGPSLVIGRKGAAGAVYLARSPAWVIDTAYFTRGVDGVDLGFGYHLLTWLKLGSLDRSTAIPSLGRDDYNAVEVALPDIPAQRRIAARIDELFSDLDAGVAALERAKANLARYRAAVLKAAVEGRLTEEWRRENPDVEPASRLLKRILIERRTEWEHEQLPTYDAKGRRPPKGWAERYIEPAEAETRALPQLPSTWCWTTFGAVADVQLGKMLSAKAHQPGLRTYPYLRNQNVRWFHIDLSDVKTMGFTEREVAKFRLRDGDLLVCEGGEPGRCAVFTGSDEPLMYQKALHRLRPYGGLISARWLQLCLAHFVWSGTILPRYSETTIQHLPLEKLLTSPVVLVPAEEQEVIVKLVESAMTRLDAQVAELREFTTRAGALRQAILRSAFQGKLI